MGHRLSTRSSSIPAACRCSSDASDVDSGAGVPKEWFHEREMMKPVERSEIVDYVTYEERRDTFRTEVLKAKAIRRTHIAEYLTVLFENRMTVRYQVQEMMRAERIVREA